MLYELSENDVKYLKALLVTEQQRALRLNAMDSMADNIIVSLSNPVQPRTITKTNSKEVDFNRILVCKGTKIKEEIKLEAPEDPLDIPLS